MNTPANEQNAIRERYKNALIDGEPDPPDWPDSIRLQISWLEQTPLPESFDLAPGSHVQDGARYRELLLQALEDGDPRSAYARSAAYWLGVLYDRFGNTSTTTETK
jgi:hypothetical protein